MFCNCEVVANAEEEFGDVTPPLTERKIFQCKNYSRSPSKVKNVFLLLYTIKKECVYFVYF